MQFDENRNFFILIFMKKLLLLMLAVVAGTMTAWAEDEIILLSYIKSTGKQAFNTGYIHKANTKIVLDCHVEQDHSSNWEALFGARLTNYHNNAFCFFSRTDGKDIPCFNRSGNEPRGTGFVYGEEIAILACEDSAMWIRRADPDRIAGSVRTTGTVDDGKTPMLFFNLNTSNTPGGVQIDTSPSCMTLYEAYIFEGDTRVHHYKPAKKNGVVGLYDQMTGTFSGSITNTPFEGGTEIRTLYPITIQSNAGGLAELETNAQSAESYVMLKVIPDAGYIIESIEVKDASGADVYFYQFEEDKWWIVMPASSVTVKVVFKKLPAGDVNGDGQLSIADFVAVLNAMAGQEVKGNADLNGDGEVTIADAVAVLNAMAGGGSSSAGGGDDTGGDDDNTGDKIYESAVVETQPEFPGGNSAMLQWLNQHMRYPAAALEQGIQGRVYVSFVVEKNGTLSGAQVLRSVDASLSTEALRLVNTMPKWTPATIGGKAVRCRMIVPIAFKLTD